MKIKEALKMDKIKFLFEDENTYDIELNGERYGSLEWDEDQKAWVLWPLSIDDGITYFEDLKETESYIKDELEGVNND
jgi:hypothetical protein